MTKNLLSIFGLIAFLSAEPAAAADICEAKVLVTVRADEDPSSLLRAGTTNTAITQLRKDKQTGRTSFCSHGGYCYPTHALVRGKLVVAQQLTNCAVNFARPGFVDDSEIVYYLTVLRSKNSSVALRYEDVDNQLLDMGVSSAGAGTAADAYVRRPGSACGQLTKRALEGNPVARRQLIAGERNACTALWRK